MASSRASIFDDDELDVSGFAPKAAPEPKAPVEQVRAIAEASNFPSRRAQPAAAPAVMLAATKRQPRRHKTGRTAQFNTRTTPETVDAYYAIADQQGWLVGETIERALSALQRELSGGKKG